METPTVDQRRSAKDYCTLHTSTPSMVLLSLTLHEGVSCLLLSQTTENDEYIEQIASYVSFQSPILAVTFSCHTRVAHWMLALLCPILDRIIRLDPLNVEVRPEFRQIIAR
ncbi:hypothetical protein L484_023019 [Morus notabilis]|uniref:Uncharacterized protein n=1 Tax=Morus notabilis TaxID=981085 RepID=W9S9F4_9ROSA|nr:hypothetical protein L484_023019 [Morus notabilis]